MGQIIITDNSAQQVLVDKQSFFIYTLSLFKFAGECCEEAFIRCANMCLWNNF